MTNRTELGKWSGKASSTSIASSSAVTVNAGSMLSVGTLAVAGVAPTSVTWGNRELSRLIGRTQSGMTVDAWILRHINNTATRTITATWAAANPGKVMIATALDGVNVLDVSQGNTQTATTDPATGTAVTTTVAATFHLAYFASRGPETDTVGTVGVGHTSGQREGTTGAPPVSNVTLHETWEELTATGNTRSAKTGATARDWANVIVALKAGSQQNRHGISAADMIAVEAKFHAVSKDFGKAVFWFSDTDGRFEAYEDSRLTTLVCHEGNGWA